MIEVDPMRRFNFIIGTKTFSPSGETLGRHKLLAARGIAVICVPENIWDDLSAEDKKSELSNVNPSTCLSLSKLNK